MAGSMHYPVAVIGGGPTGLTLVNLLGRLGVPCLLVERNLTTVQEPRAVSIDDESLRAMQAAGIIDEVLKFIVPGYGSHYYSPRRIRFAKVEPTGRPYGYPRRNAFRQPILEGQLKAALSRFDTVETAYGWHLDRYDQTSDRVTLHLTGPGAKSRVVSCDYMVGCDGASSRVRDQQGIALAGTTFDERWLILDLENHDNRIKHTEVFCDRRRPCITLPGPDDTRRFEFKLVAGETDEDLLDPAKIQMLLRTHGADPNATLRRKTVYRFHARVAPRWSFGRVFLAGDAAHLTPPFAGQGMNSGIRDAHNLAWKLAAVLRGQAGPNLLDTYEAERKDHVWQMIRLALRMGQVMSPPSWLTGFLTQTGFLALNIWPPARDYVAQMKYKPPPRFNTGFLLPDGKGRRSLVGRLLPQPLVTGADGTDILLDHALGDRFVLLLRSAGPQADLAFLQQPVWAKRCIACVVVLPKGSAIPVIGAAEFVTETDGALAAAMANDPGCVLLLRPDHYVAASLSLHDADRGSAAIDALFAATWPSGDAVPTPIHPPRETRRSAGRSRQAA